MPTGCVWICSRRHDAGSNYFAAAVLAQFYQADLWGHCERANMVLRRKRDLLLTALAGALKETCIWSRPTGGLFLWLRLPEDVDWVALKVLTAARVFMMQKARTIVSKAKQFILFDWRLVMCPMLRLPKASPCWPDVLLGAGSVMRAVSLRVCLMINGVALQRLEPF